MFWLPRASKFWFWASKSRSLVAQWESEIILSGPVSLSTSVSLVNDNFQTETNSKLYTVYILQDEQDN